MEDPIEPRSHEGHEAVLRCLKHHPLNALFDELCVEVNQEAEPVSGQLEIGQELRFVNRVQLLDGLDLDDVAVFNQQVEPVARLESDFFVDHRDGKLRLYAQAPLS